MEGDFNFPLGTAFECGQPNVLTVGRSYTLSGTFGVPNGPSITVGFSETITEAHGYTAGKCEICQMMLARRNATLRKWATQKPEPFGVGARQTTTEIVHGYTVISHWCYLNPGCQGCSGQYVPMPPLPRDEVTNQTPPRSVLVQIVSLGGGADSAHLDLDSLSRFVNGFQDTFEENGPPDASTEVFIAQGQGPPVSLNHRAGDLANFALLSESASDREAGALLCSGEVPLPVSIVAPKMSHPRVRATIQPVNYHSLSDLLSDDLERHDSDYPDAVESGGPGAHVELVARTPNSRDWTWTELSSDTQLFTVAAGHVAGPSASSLDSSGLGTLLVEFTDAQSEVRLLRMFPTLLDE
jgi:hypothetical protein